MATGKKVTASFTKARETTGTFRYNEDGDKADHKVGAIYIKKPIAEKLGEPEKITVSIAAA